MVVDRETEADPGAIEATGLNLRRCVHIDPEPLQDLRAPPSGPTAIPMLGHHDASAARCTPGRGHHQGNGGRDVEGLGRAAGAAGVEHGAVCGDIEFGDMAAHHAGRPDQFIHGRPADLDQRQHRRDLGRVQLAGEQAFESRFGLRLGQGSTREELFEQFRRIHRGTVRRLMVGRNTPSSRGFAATE